MSTCSLASDCGKLTAYFTGFAQLAQMREAEAGCPIENCPSAADMWNLVGSFRRLEAFADPIAVQEVNTLMEALADISRKWIDPQSDPIGRQIHGNLEALIDDLAGLIGETLPDAATSLKEWNSLRRVEQAMRRTLYLRQKMRPKWLSYLYSKWQDMLITRAFKSMKVKGSN